MARPTRWSTASSSTCSFTSRGEGAPLAAVVTLPQVLGPLVTSSLTLEHQLARTDGQNPVKPQGYDLHPVQPAVPHRGPSANGSPHTSLTGSGTSQSSLWKGRTDRLYRRPGGVFSVLNVSFVCPGQVLRGVRTVWYELFCRPGKSSFYLLVRQSDYAQETWEEDINCAYFPKEWLVYGAVK